MRREFLTGLSLTVAVALVVMVSPALDLGLETGVAPLLGVATGGVVGLVPDRSAAQRLAGFGAGFVFAWVGYLLRAAQLPDAAGGRAVAAGMVVLLCVAVAVASSGRVPAWSALLGASAFAGAYEHTYLQAPPEVASTSLSAATALLLTAAVGFVATAWTGSGSAPGMESRTHDPSQSRDERVPLSPKMDMSR